MKGINDFFGTAQSNVYEPITFFESSKTDVWCKFTLFIYVASDSH
jgi:hypothetical protein